MPGYYIVVAAREVVVRASSDGHVTGSVAIPVPAGAPRSPVGGEPSGSADGRHFVVVVSRGGDLPGVADVTLFRLTVSPDGGLEGWASSPSWASDGTVVVPWWHSTSQSMIPAEFAGIRQLNTAASGRSLAAARLIAFPAPVPGLQSAVIAPGGGDVIASSCRAGYHTATARVVELSATDGRLVRVLRTQTALFGNDADAQDAIVSTCQVLSVAGDGDQMLVQAFAFGRIDNGVFTSLPGMTPRVLSVSAAW